ncbi:polysaccharide biosynthesis/export family protein [Anthocerotibacter panamensis]|uniref:polysaccharide biosynthesis/export family protein n=1 Tax=Anthocerotibacter panamensis TaxID=2857077 RepID=UPI001C403C2D|nr:polysaccharide biosynthesis/export family protein [Anthocerotibacter panamensis]
MLKRIVLLTALALTPPATAAVLLSPADRVHIAVVDAEELTGDYIIRSDGTISFNQFGPVPAAGGDELALQERLRQVLQRYLKYPAVAVRLQAAGPINVVVTGAVYRPGPIILSVATLNGPPTQVVGAPLPALPQVVGVGPQLAPAGLGDGQGDLAPLRTLATAIKAAGGILPNADLERVALMRGGVTRTLDLRSALEDSSGADTTAIEEPLLAGDRIHIPRGNKVLQVALQRSQLAPEQIQVTVSGANLPNGGQVLLPTGSRLVDGLTAAGATGGSFLGNGRTVTLSRLDPATGQPLQTRLALDAAVQGESPYLLQGDAVYVSEGSASNFLDVLGRLTPFAFFLNLFKP